VECQDLAQDSSADKEGEGAMADRALNATAASLLGFLHRGPLTGWDLVATAQLVIGDFWTLTQSQVYRELSAMDRAGLVSAGDRGSRDRRPYSITDAGRAAFAAWIERDPPSETIRFPLLLTLSFGRHLPAPRLAAMLAAQRGMHAARLAEYQEQCAAADAALDTDPFSRAALEFGLGYERGVLAWFDQLPSTMTGLSGASS